MIKVVYHCYLVGRWREVVSQQLTRLRCSGLYDAADEIWVTVNLSNCSREEFSQEVKDFTKLKIEFWDQNSAEYPGINKVRELGLAQETNILYFHTKGVSNTYRTFNDQQPSDEKIQNILAWRECLEYFLIDHWKDCIDKLKDHDNVGVTCNGGWFWGNFWWSQTKHLQNTKEVSPGLTRWGYEAWLNEGTHAVNFEWFKFTYNPYVSYLHPELYKDPFKYKNNKILLHSARYGSPPFDIDEGYSGSALNVTADVKEIVLQNLAQRNFERLNIYVNNSTLGCDPIPGNRKLLFLELSPESNPTAVYKIGGHEGITMEFKF